MKRVFYKKGKNIYFATIVLTLKHISLSVTDANRNQFMDVIYSYCEDIYNKYCFQIKKVIFPIIIRTINLFCILIIIIVQLGLLKRNKYSS